NFILNGLLAMAAGGTLSVRTGEDGQQAWLQVSDTGVGIAPELRARIWDPYFTTRGALASGLGLSLCRSVLQRHAAEILFESEPGRGTSMGFRLPRAEPPRPGTAAAAGALVAKRLLLVDDDPMVRDVHTVALQEAGYEVDAVADGESALAALEGGEYQLAILD